MDPLRIILMALGIVLIAGIYFFGRKAEGPTFSSTAAEVHGTQSGPDASVHIAFFLVPSGGRLFQGRALTEAFREAALHFGEYSVYHHIEGTERLFSVANAVGSGHFDPQRMEQLVTPGLAIVMRLPGPLPGEQAFERMLAVSRFLCRLLGGELLDEERNPLTGQKQEYLREQIRQFEWRQTVAARVAESRVRGRPDGG